MTQRYQFTLPGQVPVQHFTKATAIFSCLSAVTLLPLCIYLPLPLDCGNEIQKSRSPEPKQVHTFHKVLNWGDPNWPKAVNSEAPVSNLAQVRLFHYCSLPAFILYSPCQASIHVFSSEHSFSPVAAWTLTSLHSKNDSLGHNILSN